MALYPHIPGLDWDNLVAQWRSHQPEQPGTDDGFLDEIAIEMRQRGPDGVSFLRSQLLQPNDVQVSAAILGLSAPPATGQIVPTALLDLLNDSRPRVRASAIRGLAAYGRRDALPRIVSTLTDPSPLVRCAALEFVRQHDRSRSKGVLLAALADDDDIVRMCAADELDELGDPSVMQHLRPLLADPHPDVRQAAETTIENFARLANSRTRAGAAD